MAYSAALRAARRCAAAAPDAVATARAVASGWLQRVQNSRGFISRRKNTTIKTGCSCERPVILSLKETRCSAERVAAQAARDQQQHYVRSRHSGSKVLSPGYEIHGTATDKRQGTMQGILDVAVTATGHLAMAPGRTEDTATADTSRSAVFRDHLAGDATREYSPRPAEIAAEYCIRDEAVFLTPAETIISTKDACSLDATGLLCRPAAEPRYRVSTRGWPPVERSIVVEKSWGKIFNRCLCSFCGERERTQPACKASVKMLNMERKRFSRPCVKHCTEAVVPQTSVPPLRTQILRSSPCFDRNPRAAFRLRTDYTQHHVSLFHEGAKGPIASVTSRAAVASSYTTAHRLTPPSVAALAASGVALPSPAYAGAASAASRPAPVRMLYSLVQCNAVVGSRKRTFNAPAADAVNKIRSSTRTVAGSAGVGVRNIICVSAGGGAPPWAFAATSAEFGPLPLTRTASSAAGSSREAGVVMTLPLGSLYSKTHEYVRLLLELVGPRHDKSCNAAASAAQGAGKEDGTADCRSGRPRRCRLVGFVGLSAHAAEELGEVVYCEYSRRVTAAAAVAGESNGAVALQQVALTGVEDEKAGAEDTARVEDEKLWVRRGSPLCSLESVKSVAEAYSPVEGIILAVNTATCQNPTLVWRDPEEEGWLVKLLLPLPAGRRSQGSSDDESDEKNSSSTTLYLTDADVGTAAWEQALAGPVGAVVETAETKAADNYRDVRTVAALQKAEDASAFMEACKNCQRLQDVLLGMRRRLMGPQQYMQFVEREKRSKETDSQEL